MGQGASKKAPIYTYAVDDTGTYVGPGGGGGGSGGTTPASTATRNDVTSVTTPGTLLAANANRKRCIIYNDSTAVLYILEGTGTVSATNFTFQIAAAMTYFTTDWAGIISGIWAAANGAARVTEQT